MRMTRERRTVLLAVLASLLLHLVVGISLASYNERRQPALPLEEQPPELTMVDLAPTPPPLPVVPKNAPFIDTPDSRQTKEEPIEKTFESNANSVAATQVPATGDAPVPTQDGKNLPGIDLETQRRALGKPEAQPAPQPTPSASSQTPTPRATAEPSETPEPEQLAMLRPTPPPPLQMPEQPMPSLAPEMSTPEPAVRPTINPTPSSAYRPEQIPTRMTGSISNRGVASVNALGTPLGRYSKSLHDAVGSRWYMYVEKQRDLISIGTVRLHFSVDRRGRVTNLRLVSNTSNESFAGVCLQSLQEVKLPPLPQEVVDALPPEGLDEDLSFTLYQN
ncbi:MAG: hypothetical protein ABI839_01250 [Verrucomicrobiota bacterium]